MKHQIRIPSFFVCVAISALSFLIVGCKSSNRNFYVSPLGSDNNPGTKSAPFATPAKAVSAVRNYKNSGADPMPIRILLREGCYNITEPIVFTPADSGTAEMPVTYASYPGEKAVISGGKILTGKWSRVEGKNYWSIPVPEAEGRKFNFFSLYVNGESRTRARTPDWGEKVLRAAGQEPGGDPRQALQYFDHDFDPSWTNPTDIDVVLLCSWTPTIHRITEVIPDRKVIRFKSTHFRRVDFWERNFRYYLSNVFEALDEPGEWYLNRETGILYYYPATGENPNSLEFVVPVMKSNMVQIKGDLEKHEYIEHINFEGISFQHLDGDMDKYDGVYRQGHMYLSSAVTARGLHNSSFRRCVFSQLGEYAMELADGCRNVTVEQCHFWDNGAGAIQTGITSLKALKTPVGNNPLDEHGCSPERRVENITLKNNYIHKLGTIWHGCYGIVNRFASHSSIVHNEIFDIHWDAIGLDARWNWEGHKYCEGTEIAYNHIHDVGLGYHTDAAGVYQFGPLDTHIHHNLIHDTVAYPYICGYAGLYLDEQSRGAVVENNLVYNTDWFALFLHKGVDNIFRNNLCAFARNGLIARGSRNNHWKTNYMDAYQNIYISTNNVMIGLDWDDGDRAPIITSNLYHSCLSKTNLLFGGGSFEDWQKRGRDTESVIAPSGCKDPLHYDFSLEADANACRLIEFKPFDDEIAKAGMTCDKSWIQLPESYSPRKPTKTWTRDEFKQFAAFDLDFEHMKEGEVPSQIRQQGSNKDGGFFVTHEVKAYSGKGCLKAKDHISLIKSFYPYLVVKNLRKMKDTPVRFTFAMMQPEKNPGSMTIEFRGNGHTRESGPRIRISREGKATFANRELAKLIPEKWTHFTIEFGLGEQRTGTWKLTVKNEAGKKSYTLPFRHKHFDDISWIGLMADSKENSVFYLDDISFRFGEQVK
ncbi:MAG: right-handed parallel beta-helix repeat-containing protein [Kiritimatiellia bacterium]